MADSVKTIGVGEQLDGIGGEPLLQGSVVYKSDGLVNQTVEVVGLKIMHAGKHVAVSDGALDGYYRDVVLNGFGDLQLKAAACQLGDDGHFGVLLIGGYRLNGTCDVDPRQLVAFLDVFFQRPADNLQLAVVGLEVGDAP